jgi:hypothetical protein
MSKFTSKLKWWVLIIYKTLYLYHAQFLFAIKLYICNLQFWGACTIYVEPNSIFQLSPKVLEQYPKTETQRFKNLKNQAQTSTKKTYQKTEVWKPRPKVLFKRKNPPIVLSAHCLVSTNILHYLLQKSLTIIPISTFFSEEFLTLHNKRKARKHAPKSPDLDNGFQHFSQI